MYLINLLYIYYPQINIEIIEASIESINFCNFVE